MKRAGLLGLVLLLGLGTLRITACSQRHLPGERAPAPPAGAPVLVVVAHQDDELAMISLLTSV